jgi:Na+-driven multidrug efflux pump
MSVQTAIIGRLGAAAIGANAIAAPIFQVVAVLYGSSSTASGVLIGKTVGEDDIPRVKRYVKKLQIMYLIIGVISAGLLLALKSSILGLYSVTEETRTLAAVFINILAVTVIGSAYEAPCLVGIVSGGGDTRFVLFNDLIFMWGLVLPLSALSAFVFRWPIPVTFFLLKMDQLLKCVVAVVKVNRFKWVKKLTR